MMKMTEGERYALEQVRQAGRKGLLVDHGWESVTQKGLVERGLIWQEVGDRECWKFTLSPQGRAALSSLPPAVGSEKT